MSRKLEQYRSLQIDIRAIEAILTDINTEEKQHPAKPTGFGPWKQQTEWEKVKAEFERRRAYLRKQLSLKEEEKNTLYQELLQTPLSLFSLAEMIDRLTYIEASFNIKGAVDAWDGLSAFIDTLERDETRVKGLKAA